MPLQREPFVTLQIGKTLCFHEYEQTTPRCAMTHHSLGQWGAMGRIHEVKREAKGHNTIAHGIFGSHTILLLHSFLTQLFTCRRVCKPCSLYQHQANNKTSILACRARNL